MSLGIIKNGKYKQVTQGSFKHATYYKEVTVGRVTSYDTPKNITFTDVPAGTYMVQVWTYGDGSTGATECYNYSKFNGAAIGPGFRKLTWSGVNWSPVLVKVTEAQAGNVAAVIRLSCNNAANAGMRVARIGD